VNKFLDPDVDPPKSSHLFVVLIPTFPKISWKIHPLVR